MPKICHEISRQLLLIDHNSIVSGLNEVFWEYHDGRAGLRPSEPSPQTTPARQLISLCCLCVWQAQFGALKTDSGFISPACASSNAAGSSEDSAENPEDRRREVSPGEAAKDVSNKDEDDEEEESRKVLDLLASAGQTPPDAASGLTPTPPPDEIDEGGKQSNAVSKFSRI